MRNTNSALKRIIGGGFVLATAAALVMPGIATAEEAPDTGSMDLIQGLFGGSADDTNEPVETTGVVADEGAETDPIATDIMSCLMASLGSLTGDGEDAGDIKLAVVEDDEATNSIITCVLNAIGGGSGDSAETPDGDATE